MITEEFKYKLFIASAGTGSRVVGECNGLNKALLAVNNKPAISYIIEKFPTSVEIVIALGYGGDVLRQYLELAHPDRKFTFIEIDPYEGEKSGLSVTIWQCREHLQCPFIFCANDTIVNDEIPPPTENWIGYSMRIYPHEFRTVFVKGGKPTKICEKHDVSSQPPDGGSRCYIGLAGIKDYRDFLLLMGAGAARKPTVGESFAIDAMLQHKHNDYKFRHILFDWNDTGNPEELTSTRECWETRTINIFNILPKADESIWFVNNRVIKYHKLHRFIENRINRSYALDGFVPKVVGARPNMYFYEYVPGRILGSIDNLFYRMKSLFEYLNKFWEHKKLYESDYTEFRQICRRFYYDKTIDRATEYLDRFNVYDERNMINGTECENLGSILKLVNWDLISDGIPTRYHGDLHFENILMPRDWKKYGEYLLLDWRQDFGGSAEYGDLWYDYAKLRHGMILPHKVINENRFSIDKYNKAVTIDFDRKNSLIDCENYFLNKYCSTKEDRYKIDVLTSLVFINMAPLHEEPLCHFLYYLGKFGLTNAIRNHQ
jgi:hypothetical protein